MTHTLVVFQLGEDPDRFEQAEVEHPDTCTLDPVNGGHDCSVYWVENSTGLRWSVEYSGTPVTRPGRYPLVFWHETYRGFDWTEHDASLAIEGEGSDLTEEDVARIGE